MPAVAKIKIPAKILLFADDVVLYHHDSNLTTTTIALQESVSQFNFSINTLFLTSPPHKCKSVLFTLRPYSPIIARIPFNHGYFDRLDSFKY